MGGGIGVHGRAGADQVLVPMNVVDPSHTGPKFRVSRHEGSWEGCKKSHLSYAIVLFTFLRCLPNYSSGRYVLRGGYAVRKHLLTIPANSLE